MNKVSQFDSLEMARDQIDRQMLALVAERGGYVKQAARLKTHAAEVPAPKQVAQVVNRVVGLDRELGADPAVAVATWRAMIDAYIQSELATRAALHPPSP